MRVSGSHLISIQVSQVSNSFLIIPGMNLDAESRVTAVEFICKTANHLSLNEDVIVQELTYYRTNSDVFGKEFVINSMHNLNVTACMFWSGLVPDFQLSKVARAILSMPATSAATERVFSVSGFMHSSRRNRLTLEKCNKLTFIKYNLKYLGKPEPKALENEIEVAVDEDEEEEEARDTISESLFYKDIVLDDESR